MRTSFPSSSDVIHLFAQKSQDFARCANVFFEGNKIYSYGYHYLLAEFVGDYIVINDTGYSNTTQKHISEIKSATRQYKQFFKSETDLVLVFGELETLVKGLQTARKKENIQSLQIIYSNH